MSIFRLFKKDTRHGIYYKNHNSILNDVIPHFKLVSPEKAEAIVLWADSQGPSRERALNAKKLHKPLIVVMHGKNSVKEYLPPVNFELLADKICVWGPFDRDLLINNGIDQSRVIITGSPLFNNIDRTREKTDGRNVVFAPLHWDSEIEENHEIYNELIKIKDIHLTVKLLMKFHDPKKFGNNVIITNQKDPSSIDKIFKLLRKTDIVVVNTIGTFELIAMYFNIPVILVDNFKAKPFLDLSADIIAEQRQNEPIPRGVDYTKNLKDLPALIRLNMEKPDRLKLDREKELYECAAVGLLKKPAQNIVNVILGAINKENNIIIE